MFDREADGTVVTRKEPEKLTFPRFDGMKSFKEKWAEVRREVVNRSGRIKLADVWWRQIEDVTKFTFEDLAVPGKVFEQYDGKIFVAAVNSVDEELKRKILRMEEQSYKTGVRLSGRQTLRLILEHFRTDKVAKEMFHVMHFHALRYPGDSQLTQFMEDWYRL